jgi:hypothetical protein
MRGAQFSDNLWLITDPSCSDGFDNGWDGYKYFGSSLAPQFFAVENEGSFQIDSKNDIYGTTLGYVLGEDENCTLTFTHQNMDSKYNQLYLYDMVDNRYIDITESGTQYSFFATKSATAVSRFKIVQSPGVTTANAEVKSAIDIYSVNNIVYVKNNTNSNGKVAFYDMSGKLLLEKQYNKLSNTQIISGLNVGLYIAKLIDNNASAAQLVKIICIGHKP